MRKLSGGLMAVAALGALAAAGIHAERARVEPIESLRALQPGDRGLTNNATKPSPQRAAEQRRLASILSSGSRGWARGGSRWPGLGCPVATDRRRAKKARNVQRNRRAHRG